MTRDDVTRMAREAGFVGFDGDNGSLRRFAQLVAAAEREACAKVCEAQRNVIVATHPARVEFDPNDVMAQKCAFAIRERGAP